MKKWFVFSLVLLGLTALRPAPSGYQLGDTVLDFKLKNVDDKSVALADYNKSKGIILIFDCNTCPMSKAYNSRIIALHKKFASQGFQVMLINPNSAEVVEEESFDEMKQYAKSHKYDFPYLYDESQETVKKFMPTNTPHVFILKNTGSAFTVAYIGAIDDASNPSKVKQRFVEAAVGDLLAGKTIANPKTKAIGCSIKWKDS
ncbi:MAG: thioredoxin family protein [Bacteroidetes bacterium]|nr:thioredoxin family protein [Bacteroidota bacterium]